MEDKFYTMTINKIIEKLKSDFNTGLSEKEVLLRRERDGLNILPSKKKDSIFKIFIRQIIDPIVILLIITIIFSIIIHEYVDALAITFIVIIDLLLGAFQEWRAEKNAQSLQNLIKYNVKCIRDSKEIVVDSSELVLGDIVLLESGDKISADMRVLENSNLQVSEAILTGESTNIYKNHDEVKENTPLSERDNMVYAGCDVVTGRARCIVCAIGPNTEVGQIAKKVSTIKDEKSPLTIRMEKLSKQITMIIIVVAVLVALAMYVKGVEGSEIFLSVIALSVSAMPEGLPLALTMALSITSNQMSKKNIICKKLNSVESLGSCTVIATDKTGTLTVNEQTAKMINLANGENITIDGVGYNFLGRVNYVKEQESIVKEIGLLGVLNNEAGIQKQGDTYNYYGDSIDVAFLVLGKKLEINSERYKILERIPYESENKYSAVFYKYRNEIYCTVKGSLETVLGFCNKMHYNDKETKINKKMLEQQNELLAKEGNRVIAIASGKVDKFVKKDFYNNEDIPKLTFKGMVSFIDPIRKEVYDAVKECQEAGIKVLMITGDHPLTALSIAKDLAIASNLDDVATGVQLEEYFNKGEKEFDKFIKCKKVFARVSPMDKLNIVESLKRQKEFVAVTGDGVNDAPAIRSANIGIAMGSGTDVAKETANMIITDDNFKSIVRGIKFGRTAYSNIRKVTYFLVSCGIAEVLFFLLSIIFNLPMPLVAIQLLWLNVVTDGLQDISLSCEKSEAGIMQEKPISTSESIFNKDLRQEVLLSGMTIGIVVFIVWYILLNKIAMDISIARGYIMVLMVFMQNIHVLNCRSEKASAFNLPAGSNPLIAITIIGSIILQIIVMEVPALSRLLQTSTVSAMHMVYMFAFSMIIFVIMEVYKLVKYKK